MTHKENHQLQRKMTSRHLFMLSLGGVIGTGLFLSTGFTISQAGGFGTLLSFFVGAIVVYLIMLCLGELAVHMPVTGSFHTYATRYIGPGTGFTMAWLYWLTWTVALGSEFTGAGLVAQYWFPDVPVWVFSVAFIALVFGLNALSVRFFAETEFWFSSIKVIAILLFIAIGGAAIFGLLPMKDHSPAPYLSHLTEGGLLPHGILPLLLVMLAVNFSFSGTELIGVAAGESIDPHTTIPRAIKNTVLRLGIFFVGTVFVLACLLPANEAGVSESPFVTVFEKVGLPYAAGMMNFVILTAILSAANSGLYASSRMLWSLANERMAHPAFATINAHGVPFNALLVSMLGGILALLSSVLAADQVYVILVSISGFAVVAVWMGIAASQYFFRKQYIAEGHDVADLHFQTPWYPFVPIAAFILCGLSLIGIGFDPAQRIALYCGLPFMAITYATYYALYHNRNEKKAP